MPEETKNILLRALKLHQEGNLDEAEKLYVKVLSLKPTDANALNLLGSLKIAKEQFDDAKLIFEKASSMYPDFFDIFFNLGMVYKNLGLLDKAIAAYEHALTLNGSNVEVYFNLGNLYEHKNETKIAIRYYEQAYKYNKNPNDIYIPYFLSITNLKEKNFDIGWKLHEYRPSRLFIIEGQAREYSSIKEKPLWNGVPMPDKTLFVYYECALGDTLMYLRYLKQLKGMFKKILFKPQLCFIDFFKDNDLDVEFIESRTLPQDVVFDTHIPLMSLPCVLNHTKESDIPFPEGYLKANSQKVKDFKEKFFNNDKFKIGIKGTGNTENDNTRIIDVEAFYKLFDLPNTQFYSLQKGDGEDEFKNIPKKYNVVDLSGELKDFGDTAAIVENLDLVICNDTSVAHLAGALGKAIWVALPFVQNWRWHSDISYSPWYKSAKIFKQIEPANWDEVFERIKIELEKVLKNPAILPKRQILQKPHPKFSFGE